MSDMLMCTFIMMHHPVERISLGYGYTKIWGGVDTGHCNESARLGWCQNKDFWEVSRFAAGRRGVTPAIRRGSWGATRVRTIDQDKQELWPSASRRRQKADYRCCMLLHCNQEDI